MLAVTISKFLLFLAKAVRNRAQSQSAVHSFCTYMWFHRAECMRRLSSRLRQCPNLPACSGSSVHNHHRVTPILQGHLFKGFRLPKRAVTLRVYGYHLCRSHCKIRWEYREWAVASFSVWFIVPLGVIRGVTVLRVISLEENSDNSEKQNVTENSADTVKKKGKGRSFSLHDLSQRMLATDAWLDSALFHTSQWLGAFFSGILRLHAPLRTARGYQVHRGARF